MGICTYIIDSSNGFSFTWRYDPDGFERYTEGIGEDYARIEFDAWWKDKLRRRRPHIYVWARYPYPDDGGGYLEWDS